MNHSKRHGDILRLLKEEGTITIASLADRLGVSLETIRRDVKPLTHDGAILKMHGAIGLPSMTGEAPFEKRMRENAEAKRAIARQVATTIARRRFRHARHRHDGEFPGSRTAVASPADRRHQLLGHRPHAGDRERQQGLYGRRRTAFRQRRGLRRFGDRIRQPLQRPPCRHHDRRRRRRRSASWTTISTRPNSRAWCCRAGSAPLVITDHTKFGRQGLVQVCDFNGFSELITDKQPPDDVIAAMETAGAKYTVAAAALRAA